jgi:hypothetical protein
VFLISIYDKRWEHLWGGRSVCVVCRAPKALEGRATDRTTKGPVSTREALKRTATESDGLFYKVKVFGLDPPQNPRR